MKSIKKELKYAGVPGALIGFFNGLGYSVKKNGMWILDVGFVTRFICGTLFATFIVAGIYWWFNRKKKGSSKTIDLYLHDTKLYLLLITGMLLLLWLPTYLSLFPGLFNYDSYDQLMEYNTLHMTTHHPVLHTYLVGSIVCWGIETYGTVNAGVIALMFVQILIFTLLILYNFYFLYEKKMPIGLHALTLFIYTLFPPVTLHLFSVTKDNFFTLFVTDFILINFDLFSNRDAFFENKYKKVLWVIFALGTSIFRTNAIYPIILMSPVWLFFWVKKKQCLKNGLYMFGCFVLLLFLYEKPITDALVIKDINVKREAYSVPIQQLARVDANHHDELSESDQQKLLRLFSNVPVGLIYQPLLADNPKACVDVIEYESRKEEYIDLYKRMLLRYPDEYVNSFLENTYGFWYMWPRLILSFDNTFGYMFIRSYDFVDMHSYLPKLFDFYQLFEDSKLVNDNYIWSCIFMPGIYFYILIITIFYGIRMKDGRIIGCLTFILLLWMTYLLGPVVLVRYALYLYTLVPVELAMFMLKKEDSNMRLKG